MVPATAGGIVSEPLTFDLILSSFYTSWLKAEPEEHMARVGRQGDPRPVADDRSAMQAHHPARPRTDLCTGLELDQSNVERNG
jgi:shikimate kinase